uniref:prepilin peptidase n=1 Tax=Candidatus Planktophila sp. TaxID=2175601 RepID=UPI00404B1AF1
MYALLLISSLYISLVDIATHKIRNRTLIFIGTGFSAITILFNGEIYLASALIVLSLGLLAICFGLGAGDVKLAALFALFFLPLEVSRWSGLIQGFIVGSSLLLIFHLSRRRSMADSIALAPAICTAFIWCAR